MDNKLLLVKAITLLYRESLLSEKESNSCDLVRTALEGIKLPELSLSLSQDREVLSGLKDTALYMCSNPVDTEYEKEELLQRLKINCVNDERLYDALVQGISKEMDEASIKRTVLSIKKYINDTFKDNEVINIVNKAATTLRFNRDSIKDMKQFVRDLAASIEPYQVESNLKDPAVVGSVDIGDDSTMTDIIAEIQDMNNAISVMKTGWKGLNRMLQGGLRRGDCVITPALQHNYKTGFTLSLFKQIAQYNVPAMMNPTKKPLLLRVSTEDNLTNNIQYLYQNLFENEHGFVPDLKKVKKEDMSAYIREKLSVNGYQVKFYRVNPSEYSYRSLQNLVIQMEAEGYEVHLLMVDYLAMIPTTGCEQGPAGHDLRDMWRRMRNFCSARHITMVSPHQLSSDAKMLIREGRTDFVKMVAGKGYTDGSKRLDQEVDIEIYIHIEALNGVSYLTVQRGKHRIPTVIPQIDKYIVLPFSEKGVIIDDLLLDREITLRKIGGGPIGTSEEKPFFDFELET